MYNVRLFGIVTMNPPYNEWGVGGNGVRIQQLTQTGKDRINEPEDNSLEIIKSEEQTEENCNQACNPTYSRGRDTQQQK
jgi:hypothetical protein